LSDIFDIPGMQSIVERLEASDAVEESAPVEEVEEVAEAAPEEPTEEPAEEAESAPEPDALGEAYAKALDELRNSNAVAQQQLALERLNAQRPVLLQFEDLTEADQRAVVDEATRAGVDPQTVLYWHHKQQETVWRSHMDSLGNSLESQRHEAFVKVAQFVKGNEHVMALPEEERQKFIDSIGALDAIQAIDDLAHSNPKAWAKAAISIASDKIAGLAARRIASKAGDKSAAAMKASLGSGKQPTQRVHQAPQDKSVAFVLEAAATAERSWENRLKQVK